MARYIGDYEVIRELGAGHFGTVYLAVGEVPGRRGKPGRRRLVAIKKLKDSASREAVSALLQEFALLEQVKHRSVVRVFEYVQAEDAVVMEYIHGVTLRRLLDELTASHEQVFTEAAIEIACEISDGLYQAYTTPGDNGEPLQLVHRDLKPANVMLTPGGEVKILDWGLARVDNADFSPDDPDRIKGTLMYMAPEQARGLETDHRTDLFALGLIFYELLMSRPIYTVSEDAHDPLGQIMARIESGDTAAACGRLESQLPAVGPIIARALQRRPRDRYRHGHELLVDLRRQLYRDRGAYLQEFCEFFFGSICDLGDAPTLATAASGRATSRGARLSIEERLRRSMTRDSQAQQAARTPQRLSPAPRDAPNRVGPSNRGNGVAMAPKPPPKPRTAGVPRPPRTNPMPAGPAPTVGQRRPDGRGMLRMVPLGQSVEPDAADAADATQFFAIPAPKAERARPAGPPPPATPQMPAMGAAPPPPPPGAYSPPGVGMPQAAPPPPAPIGVGIGAPPVAAAAPMVQGRVASPSTPFAVQQAPAQGQPNKDRQRVQSYRVFALVLAVFMLVCIAVVAAVWIRIMITSDPEPAMAAATTTAAAPVVSGAPAAPKAAAAEPVDTGAPPPPRRKTKRRSSSRSASSSSTGATAAAKAPSGPAPVTVKLNDPSAASAIEITCPGGFRKRASLGGGVGSISDVPQENCSLYFKGGAPAKFAGVSGGRTLNCAIVGTTATCQ